MEFVLDALLDSLKILPFLLVCYVLIEVLEYYTANKIEHSKLLSSKWSTLFASSFGLVPQCGFSVVATDLFASKKIKIGTLLAVYIATSDEAVPILLTNPNKISALLPLLLIKFFLAIIVGYSVDLIFKNANKKRLEQSFKVNLVSETSISSPEHNQSLKTNSVQIDEFQENLSDKDKSKSNLNTKNLSEREFTLIAKNNNDLLGAEENSKSNQNLSEHNHTDDTYNEQDHINDEHTEHDHINDDHTEYNHKHHNCSNSVLTASENSDNNNKNTQDGHHHGCCGHDIEGSQTKKDLWKRFLLHPLVHSLKIFSFILVVNLIMGGIIALVGEENLVAFLQNSKGFAPLVAGIVGLIPNCASSVAITELYAIGGIGFGACIAGLIVNAGIGFVVLFKENKNIKENFAILGAMFAVGVIAGYIIQFIGF